MATPSPRAASATATAPKARLAGFMAKYTPAMAKEGRAALTRMRRLVPGAVQLQGSGNVVRHIKLGSARDLDKPAIRALVKAAVSRSDVPFNPRQRARLVIRSISKQQRPRRPVL